MGGVPFAVRKRDNFDFNQYTRIEEVLITPHIFYVIGDQLLNEVLPGLKVYSSLTEFRDWLRSSVTQSAE